MIQEMAYFLVLPWVCSLKMGVGRGKYTTVIKNQLYCQEDGLRVLKAGRKILSTRYAQALFCYITERKVGTGVSTHVSEPLKGLPARYEEN